MGKINKNLSQQRVYNKLRDDLLKAGDVRVGKELMTRREVSMPKMTELATKTVSYPMLINELRNKPEKKKVI